MESKHCYTDHKHVISVLTKEYGFTYQGLGNNYEECFYKDSSTPETIFIHPMFVHYYKAVSRDIFARRVDNLNVRTNFNDIEAQRKAFRRLVSHLDEVTKKPETKKTPEDMVSEMKETMALLQAQQETLRELVTDRNFTKGDQIPPLYANLMEYKRLFVHAMNQLEYKKPA